MSMFHRILFAGDFSEDSHRAFSAACVLAREPGATLHVLNVDEPVLVAEPTGSSQSGRLPAVLPPQTRGHLAEIEKQLKEFYCADSAIATEYQVCPGHTAEEILRIADEKDVDLIILGTEGRGGVQRLTCGSVAEAVLRRSRRPVMVVRSPGAAPRLERIRRVLHPTDFSERARSALATAQALAKAEQAELVLMHVAPEAVRSGTTFFAPPVLEPEREQLARLEQESAKAGLAGVVRSHLCQGDAASEILLAAEDLQCDLIVMGSHGRTGLRRLLMGSVAETVCRKAPCPILIVRDGSAEPSGSETDQAVAGAAGAPA